MTGMPNKAMTPIAAETLKGTPVNWSANAVAMLKISVDSP